MDTPCSKCGSAEVIANVPVVSNVDRLSAVPVSALLYREPDARVFKGPITHRFLARVCGSCGYTEFYVEDPKGLLAMAKRAAIDAQPGAQRFLSAQRPDGGRVAGARAFSPPSGAAYRASSRRWRSTMSR